MHSSLESNLQLGVAELVLLPLFIRKKCAASNYILFGPSSILIKSLQPAALQTKTIVFCWLDGHETFLGDFETPYLKDKTNHYTAFSAKFSETN